MLSAFDLRTRQVESAPGVKVWNADGTPKKMNVRTYVVGFAKDVASGAAKATNDNIAKAGGIGAAFVATTEQQLANAIQTAIYSAVAGSYSVAQATVSSGSRGSNQVQSGSLYLGARVDFPRWRGHLVAYDPNSPSAPLWNAGTVTFSDSALAANWTKRRVYTSDKGTMIRIQADPVTGAILNRSTPRTLGLGTTDAEAEAIAQWMLGKPNPATGRPLNPAVLGAFVNSTPIDVGEPGNSPLPGGKKFFEDYAVNFPGVAPGPDGKRRRPNLLYVGSSDGMLHAFFTKQTTFGATTFAAGSEAFAYVPPDMLTVITNMYAQGGQLPHPDDHIYGLAGSPKVKNLRVANCADEYTAAWKTLLMMTEGLGGNEAFMLDITNPFTTTGLADPPISLMWYTGTPGAEASNSWLAGAVSSTEAAKYNNALGRTFSVPAFAFGKNSLLSDYRVLFASGYADTPPTSSGQGLSVVSARAWNGEVLDVQAAGAPPATCAAPVERTALTDVATARDSAGGEGGKLIAGYFGDTWGNLWRYVPTTTAGVTGGTGTVGLVRHFGCGHPLHFSPTVAQLDRDNPYNHSREIFLVQATNSALDPDTGAFEPSRLVFMREVFNGTSMVAPAVIADVAVSSICADTSVSPCTRFMPVSARPTATPLAILKSDGEGFVVITGWYVPPANGCKRGDTYLTIHDIAAGGAVSQRKGVWLADEQVTNVVLVNGKLVYFDQDDGVRDVSGLLQISTAAGGAAAGNGGMGRFRQLNWTELP